MSVYPKAELSRTKGWLPVLSQNGRAKGSNPTDDNHLVAEK